MVAASASNTESLPRAVRERAGALPRGAAPPAAGQEHVDHMIRFALDITNKRPCTPGVQRF